VVQSLLALAALAVAGLVLALAETRGTTLLGVPRPVNLPSWIRPRAPDERAPALLKDTGLYPLAAANEESRNPWHRLAARVLSDATQVVQTLHTNKSALLTLLAIGLALGLSLGLVSQLRRSMLADVAAHVAAALRRQIHRQIYRLGQSVLPTEGVGPVVNLFTREVTDVREGLRADLDHSWRGPILIVGLVLLAGFLSWQLSLFLLTLAALVVLVTRPLNQQADQIAVTAMRDAEVQLSLLKEDLGLVRTVRVFNMEAVEHRRFDEHVERCRRADALRLRTQGQISPTAGLLVGAAAALAFGLLSWNVLAERLSVTAVVVLTAALAALAKPTADWLGARRAIRQASRAAAGLFDYLERRPELLQAGGAQFLPPLRSRITFENVSLDSPSGLRLLDGISLEIPGGTRTAIMGRDEDSKQALVCLIPRLIDPKVGRVRVDGLDLRDMTLESIRAQVATVFQTDLVFSDSVAANIGLGDPGHSLPRIIEAAKVAHAHNFIQDLPYGYDTIIGPLGHYLRPDEQYRIALARAYLHDPTIVIIEEPGASLDDDTRHLIDDTITRLASGRTLIFLPHRLSTIRTCDRVIILHNGRIEAIGPPRDLQAESKLYRHLQYVEFNQFATGEIEAGQMYG
jgi:ATP-binding cassette subfamily B protein